MLTSALPTRDCIAISVRRPLVAGLAPGRVNLIGEHTDYNDGFVMPLAIDRHTAVVGRANGKQVYRLVSANTGKPAHTAAEDATMTDDAASSTAAAAPAIVTLTPAEMATKFQAAGVWHNYIRGVVTHMVALNGGQQIPCFDIAIAGNVPLGGGLSSSASMEVATASFVQAMLQLPVDGITRARLCQKAEHEFANTPCGIMDQYISSLAQKDHVMMLDCRSFVPQMVSFTDPDVALLITSQSLQHGGR